MVLVEKYTQGTNWKQKFQKPQNENTRLTNLNVASNGNFPILSFGDCCDKAQKRNKHDSSPQSGLMLFCEHRR